MIYYLFVFVWRRRRQSVTSVFQRRPFRRSHSIPFIHSVRDYFWAILVRFFLVCLQPTFNYSRDPHQVSQHVSPSEQWGILLPLYSNKCICRRFLSVGAFSGIWCNEWHSCKKEKANL